MLRFEQSMRQQKEERQQALARDVAKANFAQVENQLQSEMTALRAALGDNTTQAAETAKDVKYMRERQQPLELISVFF